MLESGITIELKAKGQYTVSTRLKASLRQTSSTEFIQLTGSKVKTTFKAESVFSYEDRANFKLLCFSV